MPRLSSAFVVLLPLFVGACAHYQPYPGTDKFKSEQERQEAYGRYAVLVGPEDGALQAQGQGVRDVHAYAKEVAPALSGPDPDFWADLNAADALVVGGFVASITQITQPWGMGIFFASLAAVEANTFGKLWDRNVEHTHRFNRALARDLGLEVTPVEFPRPGRAHNAPFWSFGFAGGASFLSAKDVQTYFDPTGTLLDFKFQDVALSQWNFYFARRWPAGHSLGLELENASARSYGVRWTSAAGQPLFDDDLFAEQSIFWLRGSQLWRPWEERRYSLEGIARLGWSGTGVNRKVSDAKDGTQWGAAHYSGGAPAWSLGLGFGYSTALDIDLQVELGYRSSRADSLSARERQGTLQGIPDGFRDPYGNPASLDFSGPYLRLGICNL